MPHRTPRQQKVYEIVDAALCYQRAKRLRVKRRLYLNKRFRRQHPELRDLSDTLLSPLQSESASLSSSSGSSSPSESSTGSSISGLSSFSDSSEWEDTSKSSSSGTDGDVEDWDDGNDDVLILGGRSRLIQNAQHAIEDMYANRYEVYF